MRRADRLFRIVQHLRGRRLTTAAFLAGRLGVSLRTVYRDVRDLSLSGVPIEALAVGARMVEAWGGPVLAESARTAIEKIVAALPAERRLAVEQTRLYAPAFHVDGKAMQLLESVRGAIGARRVLRLDYRDAGGKPSAREVWPLGLYFWGGAWTLGGWCESRGDFRNFRVDRIAGLDTLERRYPDQPGRRLADYLRAMQARTKPLP